MKSENGQPIERKKLSIFTVKQQYRGLTSELLDVSRASGARTHVASIANAPTESNITEKLSFNELVRCACFPFNEGSQQLMKAITMNTNLLVQYEWIIRKMSFACSAEQVAASSEKQVFERTTDAFTLQIKTDNSNSKQAYLLLSLRQAKVEEEDKLKGVFLHCMMEHQFHVISFENILDGQAQIMIEKESKAYELLTHPNAKIYLC